MASRLISAVAMAFVFAVSAANARPVQQVHLSHDQHSFQSGFTATSAQPDPRQVRSRVSHYRRTGAGTRAANILGDPRPARWCGWWARQQLGIKDKKFNLARNWAYIGSPAHGPAPGVIAVWRHHVGFVTAVPGPGRIILKSGNDGRAVRERERSTKGIIAYRWPPGARLAMQ